MSYTVTWDIGDVAAPTPAPTDLGPWAYWYARDYAKKETKADSTVLINSKAPLGKPETLRFAYSRVANVYTGTGLDPSVYAQNKTGASVLLQTNVNIDVKDDVTGSTVTLPLSAHLVLKVPNHEAVNEEVLKVLLQRVLGLCYEQSGTSPGPRLAALIRGACTPAALA